MWWAPRSEFFWLPSSQKSKGFKAGGNGQWKVPNKFDASFHKTFTMAWHVVTVCGGKLSRRRRIRILLGRPFRRHYSVKYAAEDTSVIRSSDGETYWNQLCKRSAFLVPKNWLRAFPLALTKLLRVWKVHMLPLFGLPLCLRAVKRKPWLVHMVTFRMKNPSGSARWSTRRNREISTRRREYLSPLSVISLPLSASEEIIGVRSRKISKDKLHDAAITLVTLSALLARFAFNR